MVSSASEALDAVHRSRRATHLAARSREGDVEGRGSCRRGCRRRRRAADTASTRSLQQQQARNRRSHASPQHYQQPTPPLRRSVASEQTGRDCAPARTLVQLGHRRDESLAARWPHSRWRHRPQRRRLRGSHLPPTSRLTRTNNPEKWAPAAALPCGRWSQVAGRSSSSLSGLPLWTTWEPRPWPASRGNVVLPPCSLEGVDLGEIPSQTAARAVLTGAVRAPHPSRDSHAGTWQSRTTSPRSAQLPRRSTVLPRCPTALHVPQQADQPLR
jgi:hypothetical protein